MKSLIISSVGLAVLATSLSAQKSAIYPRSHAKREGYTSQSNVHLAYGKSRVQFSYESWNLDLPKGAKVTAFGYRQDGGNSLKAYKIQFEAYMGHNSRPQEKLSSTYSKNYDSTPTLVIKKKLMDIPGFTKNSAPSSNFVMLKLDKPFPYVSPKNLVTEVRVYNNNAGNKSFSYPLDYARYYAPVSTFGAGCKTSGSSIPTLSPNAPVLGQTWSLTMRGFAGSSPTILFLGASKTKLLGALKLPFPLKVIGMPGCNQYVDMNVMLVGPTTSTSGTASMRLKLPLNFNLVGQKIYTQVWSTDVFANKAGLVTSNGAQAQFGAYPRVNAVYRSGSTNSNTGSWSWNWGLVTRFDYQ